MKPLETQEQIDEMRKRLYDRGGAVSSSVRHELTDVKVDVSRNWNSPAILNTKEVTKDLPIVPKTDTEEAVQITEEIPKKRNYRKLILIVSVAIFLVVAAISSSILYFGSNQISSDNITLKIEGPQFIGGGETITIDVNIENKNSLAIESATLVMKYPTGTRSVGDSPRNLLEERIPIEDVSVDEIRKIPINVAIFGEEDSEKSIEASIEYRVSGSNGMFRKEADPLSFKISSSPLVLRVTNIEKVASGQIVDVTMTAVSNVATPLTDILISAAYPNGFTFEKSTPEPIYGQNVWKIDKLMPEEEISIKIQGVVSGLTEETFRINFNAGPANPDNKFQVDAVLAEGKADFTIERPFIDVKVAINGINNSKVIIDEADPAIVSVDIQNTLDETVYDMVVEVVPGGNALDENSIRGSSEGFYNSNNGTVRWEVANNSTFATVFPGDTRTLNFTVEPGPNRTTSSFDLVVNVYARRVAESSAQETLIGTSRAEARYSSSVKLASQASLVSGPVPPKVGETTTYEIALVAEAGANDMSNAIVETSLPLYVNWLDEYTSDGTLTYNSVSKKIQWDIGEISSGNRKELKFKLSFQPSNSQVGSLPVLVNSQMMRANDKFTSSLLQDSGIAVTTELSPEMGYEEKNGMVVN